VLESVDLSGFDGRLRRAAMAWLDAVTRRGEELVSFAQLARFEFEGRRIALMDRQRGIRKPAGLDAALSFRTTFTPPDRVPPYADGEGPDGLVRYKYRGQDPQHPENIALRRAYQQHLPLIWFYGIASGLYLPRYPVWLIADEPEHLQFAVALDDIQLLLPTGTEFEADRRSYADRLSRLRLHQPVFRARVLTAYHSQCSICRLRHTELLDAAHILPDGHPRGLPVVPNGLALCKIHHAAYDRNILGVRPDLVVEIRADILHEIDGPMLQHGLQDMAGVTLQIPRSRHAHPDPESLQERYELFRTAS
jgi:putative restriction endonuclease